MTTLILGGTGYTGGALSKLLHGANLPFIVASRKGQAPAPFKAVEFDFFKPETFETPFKLDPGIDRVYIVMPPGRLDAPPHVISFIDFAVKKGVKRFVLLSASPMDPDDPSGFGGVHKYLASLGVDYAVLRPSWFFQNFFTNFGQSIREHDQIFAATEDSRLPFISTEDIADAAFEVLTAEKSPNKDIFIFGPELYNYEEVAQLLSSVLGREITYKRLTVEELSKLYVQFGLTPEFGKVLAGLEGEVANLGAEEALFNNTPEDRKFIGKRTLLEFFQANKESWAK